MPHLDYCVTVRGHCSDVSRLEKLRKQAARIILDCHYMTPSKDIFSELRLLPLNEWVKYRKAQSKNVSSFEMFKTSYLNMYFSQLD